MPTDPLRRAEVFQALHRGRRLFVLPNAWDVSTARLFEDAGFAAVATSSAAMMVAHGYPDGETMPSAELVAAVARIAERLSVPLSADVVSGYGASVRSAVATVRAVVGAGAVGINLEDLRPRGPGLYRAEAQGEKIRAIRRWAASAGLPIVINARTDALRQAPGDARARLGEAIRRARLYRDAGADCLYPMGLTDPESIAEFVDAVDGPVNVMVRKGLPPIRRLEALGVRRLSFGPSAAYAALGLLRRASDEIRTQGTFRTLVDGAITYDELNALAGPRLPRGASRRSPGPASGPADRAPRRASTRPARSRRGDSERRR